MSSGLVYNVCSLYNIPLYCYFNIKLRTYTVLCAHAYRSRIGLYFDTIKKEYELCCCEHKSAYLDPERRSCTSKRVSVISHVFSSWLYELSPSNHSIITVISPLIYSNAVSYLWGNYEHFFFSSRTEDLSALDKRDSALKENVLLQ